MLTQRVDLFDSTYGHFTEDVLATIRRETFGQDIGQNSWLTVEEYDRFISWLQAVARAARARSGERLGRAGAVPGRPRELPRHRHRQQRTRRRRGHARRVPLAPVAPDQFPRRRRDRAAAVRQRHLRCAGVHRFDEPLSRSTARFPGVAARSTPRQARCLHRPGGDNPAGDQRRPGAAQLDRPFRVHAARRERALHRDRRLQPAAQGGRDGQRGASWPAAGIVRAIAIATRCSRSKARSASRDCRSSSPRSIA